MRSLVTLVVVSLAACGIAPFADESGGASNLPTAGAGPYTKLVADFDTPADEPYVVSDNVASLTDPSALERDDGGYRIYFMRAEGDGGGEIWAAEIATFAELPDVAPALVIAADETWEEGHVGAPEVHRVDDQNLILFYGGGVDNPAIGRADSGDDGRTWTKHPANPIVVGARDPSIAFADDVYYLYTVSPDSSAIEVAESDDGVGFTAADEPAIQLRSAEGVFDSLTVSGPDVVVRETSAGRLLFSLFFAGERPDSESGDPIQSIGYAASFDGQSFERFGETEPVLNGRLPSEGAPSALLDATSGVLFFHELRRGRARIAVARHR